MVGYLIIGCLFRIDDFYNAEEWVSLFSDFGRWAYKFIVLIVGSIVFAIGFGICGLMIVLAERTKMLKNTRGVLDKNTIWWIVLGAASLIGIVGVFVILNTSSARTDFVVQVLLVGPLLFTLLILGPVLDLLQQKKPSKKILFWIGGAFASVLITAFVAAVVTNASESIQEWFNNPDPKFGISDDFWHEHNLDKFFTLGRDNISNRLGDLFRSILIAFNMFFLVNWFLWDHAEKTKKKKDKKPGILSRLRSIFKNNEKKSLEDEEGQKVLEEIDELKWVEKLVDSINAGEIPCCTNATVEKRTKEDLEKLKSSELNSSSQYKMFFEGYSLSHDQEKVLDQFLAGTQWDFANIHSGDPIINIADLLVRGSEGSGRTKWLLAAALCSATQLQRVLLICETEINADDMYLRLKDLLRDTIPGVDNIISCRRLAGEDSSLQAELMVPEKVRRLPDILVATQEELETTFFNHSGTVSGSKKELIQSISTILVNKLDLFAPDNQYSLPFLLGKIRLINSMDSPIKTAVLVPSSWDEPVYKMLKERLFSPIIEPIDETLGVFDSPVDKEVCIEVSNLAEAYLEIAEHLKSMDVFVIIVRALEGSKLDDYREKVESRSGNLEQLIIVGTLGKLRKNEDLRQQIAEKNCCVLVVRSESSESITTLSLPNDLDTVVIHLGEKEQGKPMPIFPMNDAEGMVATEVMNCLPYFNINDESPRSNWTQFGVPKRNELKSDEDGMEYVDGIVLKCNPREDRELADNITSDICLHEYEEHFIKADLNSNTYQLVIKEDKTSVVISRTPKKQKDDKKNLRLTHWFARGVEIENNVLDLAFADEILMKYKAKLFLPSSINEDKMKQARIDAFSADDLNQDPLDTDSYMPIWDGCIHPPGENTKLQFASIGLNAEVYNWINLIDKKTDRHKTVNVDWQLLGHYPARGGATLLTDSITFSYTAKCSILLLGESTSIPNKEELLGDGWNLEGNLIQIDDRGSPATSDEQTRKISREFWPEMTAALMAGIHSVAKGLSKRGRILAFHRPDEPSLIEVVIIELPEYFGTHEEQLAVLFKSNQLRDIFFNKVEEQLKRFEDCSNPANRKTASSILALASRQAYEGYSRPIGHCDDGIRSISTIRAALDPTRT